MYFCRLTIFFFISKDMLSYNFYFYNTTKIIFSIDLKLQCISKSVKRYFSGADDDDDAGKDLSFFPRGFQISIGQFVH